MAGHIQSLPGELWKPVVGYEGLYEVSNMGRVRRLDTIIGGPHGRRVWRGRVLRPHFARDGRACVSLGRGGKQTTRRVHVLVAAAFLGPRPEGADVCHYDGDASNNIVGNLRYDTRANNTRDALRHGTHNTQKLSANDVRHIRATTPRTRDAYKAAALRYGVCESTIQNIMYRRVWVHV